MNNSEELLIFKNFLFTTFMWALCLVGCACVGLHIIDDGFICKTYTEMGKHIGGDRVNVMRCCTGLQKQHHGFKFEHVETVDKE